MDLWGIDPLDIGIVKYEQNTINKYIQLSWYAQTSICHGNKYKRTQYNLLIYIRAKYNKIQ